MPEEFLKCVRALRKQGKDKDSAYAICTDQYQKAHGVSPQQAAGETYLRELMDDMDKAQEMVSPVTMNVREQAVISEATFDDSERTIELDILRAGVTKNGKREYTVEALRNAVPLYTGAQMFLDHSTEAEDRQRPGRSVHDLAGVIESSWFDGDAVRGRAIVGDPTWYPKLKVLWPHLGISADQIVRGRKAEAEGKERLVVEAIEAVRCVDYVTRANAGGAVSRIIESYEDKGDGSEVDLKELTVEQLREARPDLIEMLTKETVPAPTEERVIELITEAVKEIKPAEKTDDTDYKALAREVAILRCAPHTNRLIREASLHAEVEARVREQLASYAEDDAEAREKHVAEIITKERDYAARLTETVQGMGGVSDPDETPEEERKAREERIEKGREHFIRG